MPHEGGDGQEKEHLVQIDTLDLGTQVNDLQTAELGKETLLNSRLKAGFW